MEAEETTVTDDLHVVVLAAGKGTRMRSALPKVLHRPPACRSSSGWFEPPASMRPQSITVVLGHGSDDVRDWFADAADVRFVIQEPQLGTGHALLQAERASPDAKGGPAALGGRAAGHRASLERAGGRAPRARRRAGRGHRRSAPIRRATAGSSATRANSVRIVEDRDATPAERAITEINSGIYAFCAGVAVRRARGARAPQRAGRVLPARAGRRPPPGGTGRAGRAARRPRRDPRHQHPRRAGTGRPSAADSASTRAHGRRE